MMIRAVRTRVFKEHEDLRPFILKYIPRVKESSIVVVTSKIAALSQGRTKPAGTPQYRARLIKAESEWAIRTPWTWLTVKDGMVMSSAGVDESNANGKIILLPQDCFGIARALRTELMREYKVKKLGILITDSRLLPLRAGIVGATLGYAGFKGIKDDRGKKDIFGRKLKMTRIDVADALATAAVLMMGEAAEQRPLALITDSGAEFVDRIDQGELMMDFRNDVYAPLFKNLSKIKLKRIKNPW